MNAVAKKRIKFDAARKMAYDYGYELGKKMVKKIEKSARVKKC